MTVVGDNEILFVVGRGTARPVVAAVEQNLFIEHRKLVVHVVLGAIYAQVDARLQEPVRIGPKVCRFVIIGNDSNPDSPVMSLQYGGRQSVVGDREDANLNRPFRLSQ